MYVMPLGNSYCNLLAKPLCVSVAHVAHTWMNIILTKGNLGLRSSVWLISCTPKAVFFFSLLLNVWKSGTFKNLGEPLSFIKYKKGTTVIFSSYMSWRDSCVLTRTNIGRPLNVSCTLYLRKKECLSLVE